MISLYKLVSLLPLGDKFLAYDGEVIFDSKTGSYHARVRNKYLSVPDTWGYISSWDKSGVRIFQESEAFDNSEEAEEALLAWMNRFRKKVEENARVKSEENFSQVKFFKDIL